MFLLNVAAFLLFSRFLFCHHSFFFFFVAAMVGLRHLIQKFAHDASQRGQNLLAANLHGSCHQEKAYIRIEGGYDFQKLLKPFL